ncbi:MAG: glycoside hydrolase family 5 protein [Gemmataceae bacterium]
MNRRDLLGAAASACCGLARAEDVAKTTRLGVSLAGPEFGAEKPGFCNVQPGRFGVDYTYNSEKTTAYFCARNLKLLRIPVRWERLQREPGGALHEPELTRLKLAVAWAGQNRAAALIDIHNYGRYFLRIDNKAVPCVIDQEVAGKVRVSRADFANLWKKLSAAFRDDEAVWGYGLMNEPHDMGSSNWKAIAQSAVDAIRSSKDRKAILVAGDGWSNAHRFVESNGPKAWINDPAKNTAYEAHCYFDKDHTGQYRQSYAEELKADPRLNERGVMRLKPFVDWCRRNQVSGFLGEFGVPGDPAWAKVLTPFLQALADAGMPGCYWAAGEWWRDYPLSIQPREDFRQPAAQLAWLEKFAGT